jgi:hypothetical protein
VSKDDLLARLWPDRIVEEGNLHVHVSALRKALDERDGERPLDPIDALLSLLVARGYSLLRRPNFSDQVVDVELRPISHDTLQLRDASLPKPRRF